MNTRIQKLTALALSALATTLVTITAFCATPLKDIKTKTPVFTLQELMVTNSLLVAEATNTLDSAIRQDIPDKAWSTYASATGLESPEGLTQINTPYIAFGGDLAFKRYRTTAGSFWVLTSSGMTAQETTTTNGYIRLSGDDGSTIYELTKTDSYTIGVRATDVDVSGIHTSGPSAIVLTYRTTSQPTLYRGDTYDGLFEEVTNATWENLSTPSEPMWKATVDVSGKTTEFFKAESVVLARPKMSYHVAVEVKEGIVCEDGTTRVVPYVDSTSGEVKWKVKAEVNTASTQGGAQ